MNLNKKGFTLVELLAVIVVLALLMVVATSSIGSALKNAKRNTLKTEAQKLVNNVYQNAYAQYLLNGDVTKMTGDGYTVTAITGGGAKVEITDGSDYAAIIKVDSQGNITDYCVNYNSGELSVKDTGITTVGGISIEDDATYAETACSL